MRIWIKLNTNEVEKKSFYSEWTTAIARSSESYEKLWLDSCIRFKAIQICSQVTTQIIQTPSSLGEHLSQRQFSAMKLKLRTEFVSTQTPEAQHFVHFVFVVICFYLTFCNWFFTFLILNDLIVFFIQIMIHWKHFLFPILFVCCQRCSRAFGHRWSLMTFCVGIWCVDASISGICSSYADLCCGHNGDEKLISCKSHWSQCQHLPIRVELIE